MKKLAIILALLGSALVVASDEKPKEPTRQDQLLASMHAISSHTLLGYVQELTAEKYQGRLTGTPEYDAACRWIAGLFQKWGVAPKGRDASFFQHFPNPYTLVQPGAYLRLHLPVTGNAEVVKSYQYEQDFFPGSTSDSGQAKAEVSYVGYGITAPELGYDDYQGVDVAGKIVLMEREVPVEPDQDPDTFKRWRPYSFHDYKVRNARAHGAAGMLYNYHIANPNAVFVPGLLISYVGTAVVDDLFAGTAKQQKDVVAGIKRTRKPASFATGKTVSLKCVTEHHPEGVGTNVIGLLPGKDPVLATETVIIGAHLDHLGMNHELMPGANDDASGVAVLLGVAEALAESPVPLKRSILFVLFGAEEQGVKGSEYYVAHPVIPNADVKGFANLESVGRGERISVSAAKNFPALWAPFERANQAYVHREIQTSQDLYLARPRQDSAHFFWAGIPTVSFGTSGGKDLPFSIYHTTHDDASIITPEIMEDLARLVFMATVDLANE